MMKHAYIIMEAMTIPNGRMGVAIEPNAQRGALVAPGHFQSTSTRLNRSRGLHGILPLPFIQACSAVKYPG